MGGGFGGQSGAFGDKEEGKQNKKNKKKRLGVSIRDRKFVTTLKSEADQTRFIRTKIN